MTEQKPKMKLPTLDDYLMPNGEIKIDKDDTLVDIPIKLIKDFPNHPFKVKDDEKMNDLVESVKERGVLYPLLVRPRSDGTYELISGHRRKRAAQKLNIDSVKCIVKDLTDDEATILMVDSNIQREEVLPSEKAFAYKMKLEALKHQGKRTDLEEDTTSAPMEQKLNYENTSRQQLADESNESREQIRRYIRLTYLIPELLNLVDEKRIAFRPAVELSFLKLEEQEVVLDCIKCLDCTPSLAQAIDMKKRSQENSLTADKIDEIMSIEKANQIPKLKLNEERFEKVIPSKYVTTQQKEDYLYMCAEYVQKKEKMKQQQLSR